VLFINYSCRGIRDLFYNYAVHFSLSFNAVNFNALFHFLYILLFAFLLSSFVALLFLYLSWLFNWPLGCQVSTYTNEHGLNWFQLWLLFLLLLNIAFEVITPTFHNYKQFRRRDISVSLVSILGARGIELGLDSREEQGFSFPPHRSDSSGAYPISVLVSRN
jgi:hypothetical protein